MPWPGESSRAQAVHSACQSGNVVSINYEQRFVAMTQRLQALRMIHASNGVPFLQQQMLAAADPDGDPTRPVDPVAQPGAGRACLGRR